MSPQEKLVYEEDERLYRALGEFFLLWADVEVELYRVLIHYAGVTDEVGRAIFSGCRSRTMIDYLKNIIHNTAMAKDRAADLDYLCAQINTINTMRDKIAHHGSAINYSVRMATLERSLSNVNRASRKTSAFHSVIRAVTADQMSDDLRRLQYRLSIHHRKNAPTRLGEDVPRDGPTWRYIPEQLSSPKSKNQRVHQARRRPKKSSDL